MSAAVVADELTRRFGSFVAVDRVSFSIERGATWGFLGPNGAGKSTLIRMLCGVLTPTSGHATVLGRDVAREPEAVKIDIGYMSQKSGVWGDLTVREHVEFFAGIYGLRVRDSERRIETWMERFGLGAVRDELAARLPGGYRQRLAFVCAALHEPHVLFLDEPTAGVDPISRRTFWDVIGALSEQGTTIIVTTHYLDEAEHCDHLSFITAGRIIASGTPTELKRDRAYGHAVEIVSAQAGPAALAVVEALPFVRGASLYGDAMHVMVERPDDAALVRRAIVDAGLPAGEPMGIEPTLEDVFAVAMSPAGAAGMPGA